MCLVSLESLGYCSIDDVNFIYGNFLWWLEFRCLKLIYRWSYLCVAPHQFYICCRKWHSPITSLIEPLNELCQYIHWFFLQLLLAKTIWKLNCTKKTHKQIELNVYSTKIISIKSIIFWKKLLQNVWCSWILEST